MTTLTQDAALTAVSRSPSGLIAEQYFALVQMLRPASERSSTATTVGVTGCAAKAGVSSVAANLAAAAARSGEATLLLDMSSTRSAAAEWLSMSGDLGLRDALSGEARPADCAKASPIGNLSVLAVNDDSDARMLSVDGGRVHELLGSLEHDFGFVVVDLPVTDTGLCVAAAGMLEGVLLVLEADGTNCEAALRAKKRLVQANARLLGVILNKHCDHVPSWLGSKL